MEFEKHGGVLKTAELKSLGLTSRQIKKIEREVFSNAIMRYIKDPKKNVRHLVEYAEALNIKKNAIADRKVVLMGPSSASL